MEQRPVSDIAQVRDGGAASRGVTGQAVMMVSSLVDPRARWPAPAPRDSRRNEVDVGIDQSGQESSFVGGDPTSVGVLPRGLDADDPVAFHEHVAAGSRSSRPGSHLPPTFPGTPTGSRWDGRLK